MPDKKAKNTIIFIIILAAVLVAGYFIYNYFSGQSLGNSEGVFIITREETLADFTNKDKISESDVIPPQNILDKYNGYIENSQNAVETGIPSIEEYEDVSDDYLAIATSYNILGQYEKARQAYTDALEAFPDKYLFHYNLAILYATMEQYQDAALKFVEILEKYPTDYRVYDKFADLYVKYSIADDKLTKADKLYEVGVEKADNPRYLYQRYSDFLEKELEDYERALWAEREYQKITGSVEEQEIQRLQQLIEIK